jgi:ectoine hydroxylase-related dioxygenase (phytanoyl-CoA dioxygenase family)
MQAPTLDLAERFLTDGYVGPLPLVAADRIAACRAAACAQLAIDPARPGPTTAYLSAWHQQHRWVYDLATTPAILDIVERILGPDILLWATHCWYKEPRSGKSIPWHQDASYWPMEPRKTITAWIALGPCTRANGCLRIIPGSHRQGEVAQVAVADPRSWFSKAADPASVDAARAVDLVMEPGMVTFFNEATLHGSAANDSDMPRLAMSCRFTAPDVRFLMDRWNDPGRVRTTLVRGADRLHLNDAIRLDPPA